LGYFVHNLSPFAIEPAGGPGVRWYSLAYPVGFAVAFWLLTRWKKDGWLSMTWRQLVVFMVGVIIAGVMVGGRLGYALVYNFHHTLQDPGSLTALAQGGMSSHGAFVGVALAAWIFSRTTRLPLLRLGDAISLAVVPGIFLGRLGNFMNSELVGRPTQAAFGVFFLNGPAPVVPRHPSQLYEALLEGILLGFLLWATKRRCSAPGTVLAMMLTAYPVLRILGEFFREPDPQIGYLWLGLTAGQWLSLAMLIPAALVWRRVAAKI
jgi:phosphatidylglycerol:prolipoprotein diacylglycerol transferase